LLTLVHCFIGKSNETGRNRQPVELECRAT